MKDEDECEQARRIVAVEMVRGLLRNVLTYLGKRTFTLDFIEIWTCLTKLSIAIMRVEEKGTGVPCSWSEHRDVRKGQLVVEAKPGAWRAASTWRIGTSFHSLERVDGAGNELELQLEDIAAATYHKLQELEREKLRWDVNTLNRKITDPRDLSLAFWRVWTLGKEKEQHWVNALSRMQYAKSTCCLVLEGKVTIFFLRSLDESEVGGSIFSDEGDDFIFEEAAKRIERYESEDWDRPCLHESWKLKRIEKIPSPWEGTPIRSGLFGDRNKTVSPLREMLRKQLQTHTVGAHEALRMPLNTADSSETKTRIAKAVFKRLRGARVEKTDDDIRNLALKKFKNYILMDPRASKLGQSLLSAAGKLQSDEVLGQSISDAFAGKATGTLQKRAGAIVRLSDFLIQTGSDSPFRIPEPSF